MTPLSHAKSLLAIGSIVCILNAGRVAGATADAASTSAAQRAEIAALAARIAALSPSVERTEARRTAANAVIEAGALRREYGLVGPPLFHNFLVNAGVKKRGLCFQWTEDLMARLGSDRLRTLQLHWADARATTWREHNAVVVTAKGQPFERGLVLDAWRHSGRLFWGPVRADRYPWVEAQSRCQHRPRQRAGTPSKARTS